MEVEPGGEQGEQGFVMETSGPEAPCRKSPNMRRPLHLSSFCADQNMGCAARHSRLGALSDRYRFTIPAFFSVTTP
jgi:hypothetical protein